MTEGGIGYYVHHQGSGHRHRLLAIAAHLDVPLTVLSSSPAPEGWRGPSREWLEIPLDDGTELDDPTAHGTLHWVPRHSAGLRSRMATIAAWIERTSPDLVVVDVSVEVAVLVRLLGVPTVVVAMRGDRFDRAHRTAYDAAEALLVPWHADFGEPGWPDNWVAKAHHVGAISRYAGRARPAAPAPKEQRSVVVLWGTGGGAAPDLADARTATPGWSWTCPVGADAEEVWSVLTAADVVVTHGGQNAIAEVAAAGRPAVVLPDARPHGEQLATADALEASGLAVVHRGWPAASDWPALLAAAERLGGEKWSRWASPTAARDAASFVQATAQALRRTP